ncbi:MAG TPA: phage holin family protein [Solirubrobacteraceae bacterium]|nr:phage holin family protein [Solirubrobacteraceae bacterium]
MAPGEDDLRDRPIGELLKQLSQETSRLVKQELDLAKAEMAQKGKQAGLGAGFIGGGALFALGAFAALTACLIALLATVIDHVWLAALIITLVYGAIAALLGVQGKDKIQEATPPAPEQTLETLKEDAQWAKHPTRSDTR